MKEPYLVFYRGTEELAAYTLRGAFPGELEATVELLAYENDTPKEESRVVCETWEGEKELTV